MELDITVKKAKRGDKDAFMELMLYYKEYLYRTAFLYTKNQETACDVIQECIMKSMESINSLKKPEYFKSWLTKILINCALGELRKNKKYICMPEWSYENENTMVSLSLEEKMDLYEAIDNLTYPYKVIIIQKYFFDYKLQEIATLLQMPLGTVKVYHARAKATLKNQLETK